MDAIKKGIIVFSGYNKRAIISFCRVCIKYNIPIFIVSSKNDEIYNTDYRKFVVFERKDNNLDISLIKKIKQILNNKYDIDEYIVIPSTEYINRFLLDNRIELKHMMIEVPLVNRELYVKISDKYSFGEVCNYYDIDTPKVIKYESVKSFPVVLKPKKYISTDGKIFSPQIIKNNYELYESTNYINKDDFYIQEFINGESYYLLYYFSKCGKVISFSQRNLLQQDCGKSIIASKVANLHKENISSRFIKLFKDMNYTGLVMVEVRKCNDKYYMIEANPRLWGPSQLFIDANVPLFENYLLDMGFDIEIPNKIINPNALYFWYGGIKELEREKRKLIKYYSEEEYIFELKEYLKHDIYKREDTIKILNKEVKKGTENGYF